MTLGRPSQDAAISTPYTDKHSTVACYIHLYIYMMCTSYVDGSLYTQ